MSLQPLSTLASRPVSWLWLWRLALGKLAMLDGDPGLGKSLVALDLCARLSTGRPFPDGSLPAAPASALILNDEDNAADTLRPRLQALGADLERIFLLPRESPTGEPLLLPGQLGRLDAALTQTHARLVVLDPVVDFLEDAVCTSRDQSVRRALRPLALLAEQHQCVALLVRHLNKQVTGRSLYRGSGSIAFIGACRSGWLIGPAPDESGHFVLAQVKNNLAPSQPSLAYRLDPQANGPPLCHWLGPCAWTADQLLAGQAGPTPARPHDRAREFLEDFLGAGPRTSREVWEAAQAEGLAKRTLDRAKVELEVRSERQPGTVVSYWLLPEQRLPGPTPPDDGQAELEDWLGRLREQYPPPTPLDEEC